MVLCLACFDDLHYDWLMSPFRMKTRKSVAVKKSPTKKIDKVNDSKMATVMNFTNFAVQLVQVGGLVYLIRRVFLQSNGVAV